MTYPPPPADDQPATVYDGAAGHPAGSTGYPAYPGSGTGGPEHGGPAYGEGFAVPAYHSPPYGPGYSYPAPPRPTNGLAIASLVVSCAAVAGICAYGIGGLLGIVGAILGHVGRRQIRRTDENGAGMALAGIIVGWVCTAVAVLAIAGIAFLIISAESSDPDPYSSF